MKTKLKLRVDDLHVEQFQVQPADAVLRGTVKGFDCSDPYICPDMPITYSCETNCSKVQQ